MCKHALRHRPAGYQSCQTRTWTDAEHVDVSWQAIEVTCSCPFFPSAFVVTHPTIIFPYLYFPSLYDIVLQLRLK